jgi:hypothetical protein
LLNPILPIINGHLDVFELRKKLKRFVASISAFEEASANKTLQTFSYTPA